MEALLIDIDTELQYIKNSTDNKYILKQCDIIYMKLVDIKERKFQQIESVQYTTDSIIGNINNMKGVLEQPEDYYTTLDKLSELVLEIPSRYM